MITKVNNWRCKMYNIQALENCYREKRTEYFKENFAGKDIDDILYNISKEISICFMKLYIRFNIIKDCINVIKDDERFDEQTRKAILDTKQCISLLCDEFNNKLDTIYQGILDG